MLFDTDVLIWHLRGQDAATVAIDRARTRQISVVSWMELLAGARDGTEVEQLRRSLRHLDFEILPLTEAIGHRASLYMEQHHLSTGFGPDDALIAATAVEHAVELISCNARHFRPIRHLILVAFHA
jgi:predicted nucleic acid-binding protein